MELAGLPGRSPRGIANDPMTAEIEMGGGIDGIDAARLTLN